MPIIIEISPDSLRRADRIFKGIRGGAPVAMAAALNQTSNAAKNDIVAPQIMKDARFKPRFLTGKKGKVQSASTRRKNKATKNKLQSAVTSFKRGTRLIHFLSGKTKKGVYVKVKPNGNRKKIPNAFFLTLRRGREISRGENQTVGIFVYDSVGNLKHLYGPSPSQIFNVELKKNNTMSKEAMELLRQKNFERAQKLLGNLK